mgnify:CR=1 FL=1
MKKYSLFIFLILTHAAIASSPAWENFKACEKQDVLWKNIKETTHKKLPPFNKLGLEEVYKMSRQNLNIKTNLNSDVRAKGWIKYLHRRSAVAKVKIVPTGSHPYTGIFKGSDCSLLRLSLTYQPETGFINKAFAPGLALKVLRDNVPSANISALYSLAGQGQDHNFFKFPLSNIVPIGTSAAHRIIHSIFKRYTKYPEQLPLTDLAQYDSHGTKVTQNAPKQIFFVPIKSNVNFSSQKHDVRHDFMKIPKGTHLYDVYALSSRIKFNYANYKINQLQSLLNNSERIAKIVTDSPFIASEFGDIRLFFRHHVHAK